MQFKKTKKLLNLCGNHNFTKSVLLFCESGALNALLRIFAGALNLRWPPGSKFTL